MKTAVTLLLAMTKKKPKVDSLCWMLAGAVLVAACSDKPSTGPEPLTFAAHASHDRITTPGRITFTVQSAPALSRVEIYESGRKVGESVGTLDQHFVEVAVTSADNGARTYVAKGYDVAGRVGTSDPMAVQVDIRWDQIRELEGTQVGAVVWDSTGAVYAKYHTPTPDISVLLTRHGSDGKRVWERTYGGPDWETSWSHGVDAFGRVYLAGTTTYLPVGGTHAPDCFLVLYDAVGAVVWERQIATPAVERGCVAATDAAGNFYLTGSVGTESPPSLLLAKFDANGTLLWTREHEGAGQPSYVVVDMHIVVDPLGAIYVAGMTRGSVDGAPNRGQTDVFLLKFDAQGTPIWAKQYGTTDLEIALDLAADPDGGVYIAGYADRQPGFDQPFVDAFVLRYGPDGTLLWQRRLDGGNRDHAVAVAADRVGVYLLGATVAGARTPDFSEPRQGQLDTFLAKLSRGGELLWVRLLGGADNDTPSSFDLLLGVNGEVTIALQTGGLTGIPLTGVVLARHRDVTP